MMSTRRPTHPRRLLMAVSLIIAAACSGTRQSDRRRLQRFEPTEVRGTHIDTSLIDRPGRHVDRRVRHRRWRLSQRHGQGAPPVVRRQLRDESNEPGAWPQRLGRRPGPSQPMPLAGAPARPRADGRGSRCGTRGPADAQRHDADRRDARRIPRPLPRVVGAARHGCDRGCRLRGLRRLPSNGHRDFVSWFSNGGGGERYEQVAGQVDRLWVLNVNGQRLVVDATYSPDTTRAQRRELGQFAKSLRFAAPAA